MDIILFVVLWLFLNFCFLWKLSIKEILREISYYVILMVLITIFGVELNVNLIEKIFTYGIWHLFYYISISSYIYLKLLFIFILIPLIVIFIKLYLMKINFKGDFIRKLFIYLLIFYLAYIFTYIVWYYSWLIIFKKSCFC